MPGYMAHYQFGQDIAGRLNFTLKQLVTVYQSEFDIGLQGPDIFFSYQILKNPPLLRYAIKSHTYSGNQMFAPFFAVKPQKASSFAYVLGVLCHYFLDSACHGYVFDHCANVAEHWRMEAAYDKAIMRRFACGEERRPCLPMTTLDFAGIAAAWPRLREQTVEASIRAMHTLKKMKDSGALFLVLGKVVKFYGRLCPWNDAELLTGEQAEHEKRLDRFYQQALSDGEELIETIFHSIGKQQPQQERFKLNFFGEKVEA
jgi:hypothetical protein